MKFKGGLLQSIFAKSILVIIEMLGSVRSQFIASPYRLSTFELEIGLHHSVAVGCVEIVRSLKHRHKADALVKRQPHRRRIQAYR